jgi:glycyl-tRNA synthetase
VIEPSAGADRATLAFLVDAYHEEEVKPGDNRIVLKFSPKLAPIKVAVLPLAKNKAPIVEVAQKLQKSLLKKTVAVYDDAGRRHRQTLSPSGRNRHAVLCHRRF